jgi:hypothetical protein
VPWSRIDNIGAVGVIKDVSAVRLPPNAISDALNVRFIDGYATQCLGYGSIYDTPPVTPLHVMPIYLANGGRYWLYASAGKLYAVSGFSGSIVHTDITKSATTYSGAANAWTSTSLSGIPIFNNGVDAPQQWGLDLASRATDLSNWPSSTTCKALRAFKNQLVALNVTESGTNFPFMVRVSHPAVPGAVPSTWDYTDATKDALRTDVSEGGDPIKDGMQLGGTFMIYKEHSTWRMDFTGGNFVESFTKVGGISGVMNLNCIAPVEIGGVPMHVVLGTDDVFVHDGQTARGILDKQARRTLFQSIDAQTSGLAFVAKNPFLNEVWICYPQAGSSVPDRALVWNYQDNTTWFREIPSLNHAAFGPVESGISTPFNSDSAPFDSLIRTFNSANFTPDASRLMLASNNGKLYLADSSATYDGTLPTNYVQRQALTLATGGQRTLITAIRPIVSGTAGQTLTIKAGGASDAYSDPTFTASGTYTIGTTDMVGLAVDTRYPAWRIEGDAGNFGWKLDALEIEWQPAGLY